MKYLVLFLISINLYSKVTKIDYRNCVSHSNLIKVKLTGNQKYEDDYDKPLDQIIVKELLPNIEQDNQDCSAWINGNRLEVNDSGHLLLISNLNNENKTVIAKLQNSLEMKSVTPVSLGYRGQEFIFKLEPFVRIQKFDIFQVYVKKWIWGNGRLYGNHHKYSYRYHEISFSFDGKESQSIESKYSQIKKRTIRKIKRAKK